MKAAIPKTLILDLDGTLLDGRDRLYRCYQDILNRHGFTAMPAGEYWELKRARADRRVQLARTGAESLYDQFLEEWLRDIESPGYLALDTLHPGVASRLSEWKVEGFKRMLVTLRQNETNLRDQLERLGIIRYFDHILVCDHAEGGEGKAARIRSVENEPSSCLWIGDTEVDIAAARSLGCRVWAVSCGVRTGEYLRSLKPDFLSETFIEVNPHV